MGIVNVTIYPAFYRINVLKRIVSKNDYSVQGNWPLRSAGTVQSQGKRVRRVKQLNFKPGPGIA